MAKLDHTTANPDRTAWKLQDAKAQFCEVVRLAQTDGPQRVTVRGHDAVVVISVADLDRLSPPAGTTPFLAFMEGLGLDGLDLTRDGDAGRDAEL